MREQIDWLVKLQQIESETRDIKAVLDEEPGKNKSLEAREKKAKKAVNDESSQIEELRKKYRSYDSDVKANLDKIEKSQGVLNNAKNNTEYQAALKEIEGFRKKNSKIEDNMLKLLDRVEESEKNLELKKNEYSQIEVQISEERKSLNKEVENARKRLAELEEEWQAVSEKVDPRLMRKVAMVKELRGSAIAEVKDAVCQGCNMNIPPQMYNDLQRTDALQFCPYCERIIYWEKAAN